MRILFVRHGHPNYEKDCLTELGHLHAAAAAERLQNEGIEKIFSSTCGRALETAGYTARKLNLPITEFDFMREIGWGTLEGVPLYRDGHPWDNADKMVLENIPLMEMDAFEKEPLCRNKTKEYVQMIARETDTWLSSLGYDREGNYYRCREQRHHTVAAFGHGGASAAMLSHLFNLPFLFVCCTMGLNYTGITAVTLKNQPGQLMTPCFEILNDARHIAGLEIKNVFDR